MLQESWGITDAASKARRAKNAKEAQGMAKPALLLSGGFLLSFFNEY